MSKIDEQNLTHDNFFAKLDRWTNPDAKKKDQEDMTELARFIKGGAFMEQVFPEQAWLVDPIIPLKGMVCLAGMPSSYKSWFGFYLALCVMRGEPILHDPSLGREGWKVRKGKVLFIDKENIEAQIQKRFKMFGAGAEMENCYFFQGDFTTESQKVLAAVVGFIKEEGIDLVIIDSLVRVHARNENDAIEMNKVFERLSEIQHAGAAVLYLHHLRKASNASSEPMERLRGSVDISARLDSLIAFETLSPQNMIAVTHGKSRYVEPFTKFLMTFTVENGKAYFNFKKEFEESQLKEAECKDMILALLAKGSITRKTLHRMLVEEGIYSNPTFRRGLEDLKTAGRITSWRINGNELMYDLVREERIDN